MQPADPPTEPLRLTPLPRRGSRLRLAAALAGALVVGAGLTAVALPRQQVALATLTPAPIKDMHDWSAVAVKGQVADVFGNRFVVQDDSGRALVDSGPEGEGTSLVAPSETVTVQGRFERGQIHAVAIQHADGRSDLLGPPGPPPFGPAAWLARHWPHGRAGAETTSQRKEVTG